MYYCLVFQGMCPYYFKGNECGGHFNPYTQFIFNALTVCSGTFLEPVQCTRLAKMGSEFLNRDWDFTLQSYQVKFIHESYLKAQPLRLTKVLPVKNKG